MTTPAPLPGELGPLAARRHPHRKLWLMGAAGIAIAAGLVAWAAPHRAEFQHETARDPGGLSVPKSPDWSALMPKPEEPPVVVQASLPVAGDPKPEKTVTEKVIETFKPTAPAPAETKDDRPRSTGKGDNPKNDIRERRLKSDLLAISGGSGSKGLARDGDNPLARNLTLTDTPASQAERIPEPEWTIAQGTLIPCTMMTEAVSEAPGMATCMVDSNVYSMDENATNILIHAGAKILMESQRGPRNGQSRWFMAGSTIIDGDITIPLASPVGGELGQAGVTGHIDRHFAERFGTAVMLALIGDLGSQASTATAGSQTAQGVTQGVADMIGQDGLIPPTVTVPRGAKVTILTARFLDFSSVLAGGYE